MTRPEEARPEMLQRLPQAPQGSALGRALDLDQRPEQGRQTFHQFDIVRCERPLPFEAQRPDAVAHARERDGQHRGSAMRLRQALVRLEHLALGIFRQRPYQPGLLVGGLIHGHFDGAGELGILLELNGMRQRLDLRALAAVHPEGDPVAIEQAREFGDRGGGGRHETVVFERGAEDVEHPPQSQGRRGIGRIRVAPQQRFEPAGAPGKIAGERGQITLGARLGIDGDRADDSAIGLQRLRDMQSQPVVAGWRHHQRVVANRALDRFAELGAVALRVGPDRGWHEPSTPRLGQHQDAVGSARLQAGDAQPCLAEDFGIVGIGESRPGVVLGGGTQASRIGDLQMRSGVG